MPVTDMELFKLIQRLRARPNVAAEALEKMLVDNPEVSAKEFMRKVLDEEVSYLVA